MGLGEGRWQADAALTELYHQHWASLVRLSYLLVRDQTVAEELTQDAFVSMHRKWAQLRDTDKGLAYLRQSVVNASRSALRRRTVEQRYISSVQGHPDTPGVATAASAEKHALAEETTDEVIAALRTLSSRQREVLTLRYFMDLDEAAIAEALSISKGSVKTHASRGLAALREAMGESAARAS